MNADERRSISHFFNLRASAFICGSVILIVSLISGCEKAKPQRTVVLYTSIDQPVAAPIVREFEKQTGIHVTLVTDTEATKSVGLAEKLRAEKSNPQADVWWSNEPFHTINLAEEGVLSAYDSPASSDVPTKFKDPDHRWASNGFRVRVIVSTGDGAYDESDLLDARYRDRVAIARPSAGTMGGHIAALYVLHGDEWADKFFHALRANGVKLLGGNGPVAEAVAAGKMQLGLTDNDDVQSVRDNGAKIEMFLLAQGTTGTLIVPTTIGLVTGAPHSSDAKQLIDFLLSKEVERKLMDAKFAYGSIRSSSAVRAMNVDYRAVAQKLPEAVRRAAAILEGRE